PCPNRQLIAKLPMQFQCIACRGGSATHECRSGCCCGHLLLTKRTLWITGNGTRGGKPLPQNRLVCACFCPNCLTLFVRWGRILTVTAFIGRSGVEPRSLSSWCHCWKRFVIIVQGRWRAAGSRKRETRSGAQIRNQWSFLLEKLRLL